MLIIYIIIYIIFFTFLIDHEYEGYWIKKRKN